MDSETLRLRGHVWYVLEVGLLVYCLFDLAACQYKLGVGEARGLSSFWSDAGRVATLILVAYLCLRINMWYRGRVPDHKLSCVRLFLSTQVLAWLFALYDGSDFHAIRAHFAIGLGVGFYALLEIGRGFAVNRFSAKGMGRADVILFSLCASVLGMEITLRSIATISSASILSHPDDSAAATIQRNAAEPGKFYFGFPYNTSAYYDDEFGPKPASRKRVVSIGDSFSTGVVPHYYHFTTVAERAMTGVDVLNVGGPGLGPFEYLYLLQNEAVTLKPNVVIVNVFLGDDLVESWTRRRERLGPKRTILESWYTRSTVYLYLVMSRFAAFAVEAYRLPSHPDGGSLGWEKGTKIAQYPAELARAFPWISDPLRERSSMSDESFMELELRRAREIASRQVDTFAPAFFEAMERIRGDIEGTPWAIVLIPDGFQVNDGLWKSVAAGLPGVSLNRFRSQAMVNAWAAERQIPCLDLTPALRAAKPARDGRRHVFHRNDTHFNVRGNSLAGRALADFLAKQFPFLER